MAKSLFERIEKPLSMNGYLLLVLLLGIVFLESTASKTVISFWYG